MYKLIAIDMDGTLLKDDKSISDITKMGLKSAQELGVKIVLTSGRPIQGIKKYLDELDLTGEEDYVIGLNGALICKTSDYSVVSSNATLTGKDLKYIYNKVKGLNTYIHAFTNNGDLVNKTSKFSDNEEKRLNLKIKQVDFLKDVLDNDEILKVVLEEEKEVLDKITAKVPKELFEEYNVIRSVDFMLEFMNRGCNKASGLQKLVEYLGISKEEIIAIGDAENDIEMIEYAGLGVAMGNAKEEIKSIANFITKSNEEDGVTFVIEKFIVDTAKGEK
ncbi:Cof-type HAD-IIB family hydrolase [Clostridium sp. 'White wine YQ']|uniref:Cof-type HAD-IIB family hydrolase n=1 Tax=Clostridium sp. 'White wine YQ' TaxID=3027474 RepID=UPI002366DF25|nr:Cof-type HAD-IIB family hydrolase [Clostridium sp. 'White wine YQ']MDD7794993.1 Cof-type HAD-IIB family hydrolase [Clostridium sp. 'White wine YQ']